MILSTTTQQLITGEGKRVEFELGPPANIDSFFVFSMHKTGSTLLNNMLVEVCQLASIPIFSPEQIEFRNGLPMGKLDDSIQQWFVRRGYCFSGFRQFPDYLIDFDLGPFRKILLVRDPRDMVVSHYFSHKISHPMPPGELGQKMKEMRERLQAMSIDEYSLWFGKVIRESYGRYASSIFDSNLRVFRYEDVIFRKRQWLTDVLEYAGVELPQADIWRIADSRDVVPEQEDATKHIRRVTPGDHIEKLKPETIAGLNELLGEMLARFNYSV